MNIALFFFLLIPILTASTAQLFFKKGVSSVGHLNFSLSGIIFFILRVLQNSWMIGGVILFAIAFLSYLLALSKFQLNVIYPILVSAGIILVTGASWLFFKETLSWLQILGMVIILFGIFLLAING